MYIKMASSAMRFTKPRGIVTIIIVENYVVLVWRNHLENTVNFVPMFIKTESHVIENIG